MLCWRMERAVVPVGAGVRLVGWPVQYQAARPGRRADRSTVGYRPALQYLPIWRLHVHLGDQLLPTYRHTPQIMVACACGSTFCGINLLHEHENSKVRVRHNRMCQGLIKYVFYRFQLLLSTVSIKLGNAQLKIEILNTSIYHRGYLTIPTWLLDFLFY